MVSQTLHDFPNQYFRRGRPGGDAERGDIRHPGKIDIASPLNQTERGAFPLSHFDETKRIGAVGRTDHEHKIARGCDRLDRCLPVGRSVADVLTLGRSEEHTSELQSLMRIPYAVFCLKKKKTPANTKRIK